MKKNCEEIAEVINVHSTNAISISIIEGYVYDSFNKKFEKEIKSFVEPSFALQPGSVFLPAYHFHSDFSFSVNYGPSCLLQVEKKDVPIIPGKIHAINPEQGHTVYGCTGKVLGLNINSKFLHNIAQDLYGKKEMICFNNQAFDFNADLQNLIQIFRDELINRQRGYQLVLQSISVQMAIVILRNLKSNIVESETKVTNCETYTKQAIEYLNEIVNSEFNNTEYSLEEIAEIAKLSPYHFIRIFKKETGKTPYEYYVDLKIKKAKELLKNNKLSILETSFRCGFTNSSHFANVFKKSVGLTPSNYRKLIGIY